MSEKYLLREKDDELIEAAKVLLKKVAAAPGTRPGQLVSIAKLQHVLSVLPRVTEDLNVSVSVCGPRHTFDGVETFHWWDVAVEDNGFLKIESGGHLFQPTVGGDTFAAASWTAFPEQESEFEDNSASLWMVPDLTSYSEGVLRIDLTQDGYKIEILDEDNPLLHPDESEDEASDEDGEEFQEEPVTDEPSTEDDAKYEIEQDSDQAEADQIPWILTPQNRFECCVADFVDASEVNGHEPAYNYGVGACGFCEQSLSECGIIVDGRVDGDLLWGNMCARCFARLGAGIGTGDGQIYAHQPNGEWRLVAGWDDTDKAKSLMLRISLQALLSAETQS